MTYVTVVWREARNACLLYKKGWVRIDILQRDIFPTASKTDNKRWRRCEQPSMA